VALVGEGRRIREELVNLTNAPRELLMLAESHNNEANTFAAAKEFARSAEALANARKVLGRLPADQENTFDAARMRGWNRHLEGYLFVREATEIELALGKEGNLYNQILLRLSQEKLTQAEKALDSALEIRSNLSSAHPESAQAMSEVSQTYVMLGNVALRADKKKAIERYTKACEVNRKLLLLSPEDLAAKLGHGITAYSLANAMYRAGTDLERVTGLLSEALGAARPVFAANPAATQPRVVLEAQLRLLVEVRLKQGRHGDVVAAARELREVLGTDSAKLVGLAGSLAGLAKSATQKPDLKPAAAAYADEAVATLTRAVDAGFRDPTPLAREPFAALAGRADYQALVAKLGGPKKE
jgi:tetratricopeptide (TPR) repeat protein